jgi:hypothetical protein
MEAPRPPRAALVGFGGATLDWTVAVPANELASLVRTAVGKINKLALVEVDEGGALLVIKTRWLLRMGRVRLDFTVFGAGSTQIHANANSRLGAAGVSGGLNADLLDLLCSEINRAVEIAE